MEHGTVFPTKRFVNYISSLTGLIRDYKKNETSKLVGRSSLKRDNAWQMPVAHK